MGGEANGGVEQLTEERGSVYGPPIMNHTATADLFFEYLKRRYAGLDLTLDALDVCAFNILQKLSRLGETPDHEDSWRDIAGYAANALEIIND